MAVPGSLGEDTHTADLARSIAPLAAPQDTTSGISGGRSALRGTGSRSASESRQPRLRVRRRPSPRPRMRGTLPQCRGPAAMRGAAPCRVRWLRGCLPGPEALALWEGPLGTSTALQSMTVAPCF